MRILLVAAKRSFRLDRRMNCETTYAYDIRHESSLLRHF